MLVPRANRKPEKLKLSSYALVRASPSMIGISEHRTVRLVFSPTTEHIIREMAEPVKRRKQSLSEQLKIYMTGVVF